MKIKCKIRKSKYNYTGKQGWGCGYVTVPYKHTTFGKIIRSCKRGRLPGFSEAITYCEMDEGGLQIGFDTAHLWCDPVSQNRQWVQSRVKELKELIEKLNKNVFK
jgi:hypothetical protein